MDFTVLVAVVVGLTEVIKRIGLPTKWCPLLALAFGVGLNLLANATHLVLWENIIEGILIGLSSQGLYDTIKKPVNFVVKKVKGVDK